MTLRLLLLVCVGGLCLLSGCRGPVQTSLPAGSSIDEPAENDPDMALAVEPPSTRVDIEIEVEDPDRWLTVERIHGDAPGAWATGAFDPARNKFTIETHDVAEFTIDVSRVPVRWDRLVIIRIDGSNSELVKRDYFLYRIARNEHGQWIVLEP